MIKNAQFTNRNLAELLQVLSLFALSVFLIIPNAVISITLVVFSLSSLFLTFNNKVNKSIVLLQIGFYVLLLMSIFFSVNKFAGFGELKGNITLFFFPLLLLFFDNRFLNKAYKFIILLYVLANLGLVVILFNFFSNGIVFDRFPNLIEEGVLAQLEYLWSYPFEFILSKSLKGGSSWFINHKTILALNFLLACLFSLKLFFVDFNSSKYRILLITPIIILVPAIVYTQSLINIALLPLLVIFVLLYLQKKLHKISFVILISIAVGITFFNSDLKKTFNNGNSTSVVNLYYSLRNGEINLDADPRSFIYYCDLILIRNRPFFGYGIGDVQDQLSNCYDSNNFKAKHKQDRIFNSHNFYAHLMLAGGLLPLIMFLWMFWFNSKISFTRKDYAYLFFLIIFSINLLLDNVILRFQGSLCFAFFNSLFLWKNLNNVTWKKQ